MSLRPWVTIPNSREIVHENAWYSVYREKFVLPSGKEGAYHVVHSAPSVLIIPLLSNGKIRMVNQFRYVVQGESMEFVSGNTRHGNAVDTPLIAAERELAEEAHLAGTLEEIGKFFPWNGALSEQCHVFVAHNCTERILPADETEEFERNDMTIDEINTYIIQRKISDGMTLAAWMLYKSYANI